MPKINIEKMDEDFIQIRFKKKHLRWIERSAFIFVILILIALVFYNPFNNCSCDGNAQVTAVSSVADTQERAAAEPEIELEDEPDIKEVPDIKEEATEEKSGEEGANDSEEKDELSGEVGLTIGEIGLDEDKKRIEYVWLYINNDKGLFTPKIQMTWYWKGAPELVKQNIKYVYTFPSIIPLGKSSKKLDEEIGEKNKFALNKRMLNLDEDELKAVFKIELYDAKDNSLLDTKYKTILIS